MGTMGWQGMLIVGGSTFVILGALLLLGLWYQRHLGIVPGGAVSTVSVGRRVPSTDAAPAPIVLSPEKIMSWERDRRIVIGAHRLRMTRKTKTENRKLTQLKTENRTLRRQLEAATDGQAKGIDLFLEAERAKKPLTRTAAALLMGRDKSVALQLIRDREPVPDEIARPAPLPV